MGKIGFGYGSEYQLMRFLGRHRNELNKSIKELTGLKEEIVWFDFLRSGLLDKEILNVDFVESNEIKEKWNNKWPTNNNKNGINWDAIGLSGDTFILVEAKAHEKELNQAMGAKNKESVKKIHKAFYELCSKYDIEYNDSWIKDHYQLANHLVALDFLNSNGYKAILLNVFFINGYEVNALGKKLKQDKSVKSEMEWKQIIHKEHKKLGIIGNSIEYNVFNLFIRS